MINLPPSSENFVTSDHGITYKIQDPISRGVFGRVFDCIAVDSGSGSASTQSSPLVIKVIQGQRDSQTIEEIALMQKLKSLPGEGFPTIIDWGYGTNAQQLFASADGQYFHFIIEKKLGITFMDLVTNQGQQDQIKVLKCGVQLIQAIEKMHELGHLHRDIKPDNLLFQHEEEKHQLQDNDHQTGAVENVKQRGSQNVSQSEYQVYLIDFGKTVKYARKSRRSGNLVIIPNQKHHFIGNPWWSSKNVIQGNQHSRRDDVISLFYSLVWLGTAYDYISLHSNTEEFMGNASPEQVCKGAEYLTDALREAYSYEYHQRPNNQKLIKMFHEQIEKFNNQEQESIQLSEDSVSIIIEDPLPLPMMDSSFCYDDTDEGTSDHSKQVYFQNTLKYNENHPLFLQATPKLIDLQSYSIYN